MASTINFGIDLGTSNSLIAKFDRGNVEVYKNPDGFKETLPSVVGFRNDRILIGERARTYLDKDPKSVIGRFNRKMGTSETFKIKSLSVYGFLSTILISDSSCSILFSILSYLYSLS